jgi:hypothetical protein
MINWLESPRLRWILSACLLTVIAVCIGGCGDEDEQLPVYRIKGPLKVSYAIATSDTGTRSTNGPMEAKEIRMYERYVVIQSKSGSYELLPVDRIKSLNWKKE